MVGGYTGIGISPRMRGVCVSYYVKRNLSALSMRRHGVAGIDTDCKP